MAFITDKQKAFSGGSQKDLILEFPNKLLTVTNSEIKSESLKISESISSDDSLLFGSAISSEFNCTVSSDVGSLKGQKVIVKIKSGDYTETLGTFKIYSDTRADDKLTRDLVGYDVLYYVGDKDYSSWYNLVTFPTTLKNFRDAFFQNIGVEQVQTTLLFDNMTLTKDVYAETLSGFDIISSICELNGVFGHINNLGKFEYISIEKPATYPNTHVYETSEYAISGLKYEDWKTSKITKVTIRTQREDEDGNSIDVFGSYGTDGNEYVIQDNLFTYGSTESQLQQLAESIYNKVKDIQYYPGSLTTKHNTELKLGDFIKVEGYYDTIEFPVLEREIKGITALKNELSAKGVETYDFEQNSIQRNLSMLQRYIIDNTEKVAAVRADLGEFQTLVTENFSTVNADIINLKANNIDTDNLNAAVANIDTLTSTDAIIQNIQAQAISTEYIKSVVGDIGYLTAKYIEADDTYTLTAKIGDAYIDLGLIKDAVISNGKITGYLDAVEVNANSITAGTLQAGRIIVDSLVYKVEDSEGNIHYRLLDVDEDGNQSWASLNGDIIEDKTITADKIVAHSITSNEITTENIQGASGWLNLAEGTFNYGDCLVWDGANLRISSHSKFSSKNILPFPYYDGMHKEMNGITFDVQSDGTVIANGTATAKSTFALAYSTFHIDGGELIPDENGLIIEPSKTYTITAGEGLSDGQNIGIRYDQLTSDMAEYTSGGGNTYNGRTTFTSRDDTKYLLVSIEINSGKSVDNFVFKPMVELGNVAHDYERYIGNKSFNDVESDVTNVSENFQQFASQYETQFEFTEDGLRIGRSGNAYNVTLTNERLSFNKGNLEVAYIDADRLYITNAEILTSIRIGDFKFVPRKNGNLSFKHI